MKHLELPIAGLDDVAFRYEPCRLHGRAAVRREIVAGEGNGLEHEVGRLDSGPAKLGDLVSAAFRKTKALRAGPRKLGRDRDILVDSGMGVAALRPVADRLSSRPRLVFTTHAHVDHVGSHPEFADCEILVHPAEADEDEE
jgi:glyoxylase-like metal-dependent hydrolase (beta-lactamase superfamily II)